MKESFNSNGVHDPPVKTSVLKTDSKINKYFNAYDGIVRKLEKDRFFVVMKEKGVSELAQMKLVDVRTVERDELAYIERYS